MIGATGSSPATLIRKYPGRLLDVSSVGCLIETTATVDPGTVGTLEVVMDGCVHVEAVRVARSVAGRNGHALNEVGLEFLLLAPPGVQSLRAVVARLAAGVASLITFVH